MFGFISGWGNKYSLILLQSNVLLFYFINRWDSLSSSTPFPSVKSSKTSLILIGKSEDRSCLALNIGLRNHIITE